MINQDNQHNDKLYLARPFELEHHYNDRLVDELTGEILDANKCRIAYHDPNNKRHYINRKASYWRNRLRFASLASRAYMVTLTYDEQHVVTEPNHEHISLFIKRLRRYIDYHCTNPKPIKYFAVPEFGEENGRLHYHLIIYNLPHWVAMYMCRANSAGKNIWNKGFVNCKKLTFGRVYYVTKYMTKQLSDGKWVKTYKSRKIGVDTALKYKETIWECIKNGCNLFVVGKRKLRIPDVFYNPIGIKIKYKRYIDFYKNRNCKVPKLSKKYQDLLGYNRRQEMYDKLALDKCWLDGNPYYVDAYTDSSGYNVCRSVYKSQYYNEL